MLAGVRIERPPPSLIKTALSLRRCFSLNILVIAFVRQEELNETEQIFLL